jgi:WD40 repeat protein
MRGKGRVGGGDVHWRKAFAERARKHKNWKGKPNYVATLRGHTLAVMSVISNGRSAASCSLDGTIRTWDLDKRRCTGVFSGHTDWVNSIDYDSSKPDLDYVVSGSYDTSVRLWDTKNKKCKRILWGHQNIVWSVQLAGNRAVSCSSDATVRVWDVEAGVCTQTLTGHDAAIYCCQYDPVRNVVVSGSMDKTLRFWDLNASGNSKSGCVGVMRGHADRLCCLQEDPKENLLVSGSRDSTIRLWDTRVLEGGGRSAAQQYSSAGDSRACFRVLRGHEGRVCCLQFDEDKIVSGSDDNTVKVWSLHGKGTSKRADQSYCLNTFTAHDYWVNSLKFQDNMLISGAADDTIKIWDFSPRGPRAASKKTRSLWYADVVSSRPQQTYITNPITSACILS